MKIRPAAMAALLGAATFGWAASAQAISIYSNDFEGGSTANFSGAGSIQTAPDGVSHFLGYLAAGGTATLTLSGVGAHNQVTLDFDMYGLNTLDGFGNCCGPDSFRVALNGATLLDSTFANPSGNNQQGYPDPGTSGSHPAQTGAVAVGQMGFGSTAESTYHFSFVVADANPNILIDFVGASSQSWSDEGFGIDNINVSVSPVPVPAALPLMGSALAGLALWARRKNRRAPG